MKFYSLLALAPLLPAALVLFKALTVPPLGELLPVDLTGKTFVITGATTGLGLWHAEQLAAWNAALVLPVRDVGRGTALADRLAKQFPNAPRAVVEHMDLNSLESVRDFAKKYSGPVDVLVNNAALLSDGELHRTKDGFEECFQVNYLSHALLTSLLLDRIEQSSAGRVVHVSAKVHESANLSVNAMRNERILGPDFPLRQSAMMGNLGGSYADSKLAQVLFSAALNRRLRNGAVSISLHPAITETELLRDRKMHPALEFIMKVIMKNIGRVVGHMQSREDGPKTQIHVSTHPAAQEAGGKYFSATAPPLVNCGKPASSCGVEATSEVAADSRMQEEVFRISCELLGLEDGMCGRIVE